MKKYYVTAPKETDLKGVLQSFFPDAQAAKTCLFSGGVWIGQDRQSQFETRVKKGTTVTIYRSNDQAKQYFLEPERIVQETHDFIVVDKLPMLSTVSDEACLQYNLTYGVRRYFRDRKIRHNPTPITRLDQPVQGLVIYAKNKPAEMKFFDMVQNGALKKTYSVLLESKEGLPKCQRTSDRISFHKKAVLDPKGREAKSLFLCKDEQISGFPFYTVILFTGRRHQIRFHAFQYLSPILGDRRYGAKTVSEDGSIALIAAGYNFEFKGKRYRIRLPDIGNRFSAFASH